VREFLGLGVRISMHGFVGSSEQRNCPENLKSSVESVLVQMGNTQIEKGTISSYIQIFSRFSVRIPQEGGGGGV